MAEKNKKRSPGRPPGSKNKNSKSSKAAAGRGGTSAKAGAAGAKAQSSGDRNAKLAAIRAKEQADRRLRDEIWGVVILAAGVFLILCTQLRKMGVFGDAVHDALRGLFGILAYVLPYFFIALALCLFFKKMQHINGRTVFFSALLFISMCTLNSARFIDAANPMFGFDSALDYYEQGVKGELGGMMGMWLGSIITKFIGKPGLIVLSLALIVISLLLVINTPLSVGIEKARERREERALLREAEAEEIPPAVKSTPSVSEFEYTRYEAAEPGDAGDRKGILGLLGVRRSQDTGSAASQGHVRQQRKVSAEDEMRRRELVSLMDGEPLGAAASKKKKGYGLGEGSPSPGAGYGLGSYSTGSSGSTGLSGETAESEKAGMPEADDFDKYISERNSRRINTAAAAVSRDAASGERSRGTEAPTAKDDEEIRSAAEAGRKKLETDYVMPPIDLLRKPKGAKNYMSEAQLNSLADLLETTLREFNVEAKVIQVTQGSSVTRFEIQPARGVKVSRITSLADDIALNLRAKSIRIEAPIPGKAAVGIEIENEHADTVVVRELIASEAFRRSESKVTFAVGKDISGNDVVADLRKMPHLLIAGATGSGKSVCINTIITSIIYKATPDEVKFVMIDPKVVELVSYNDIPHLLIPVVTDPKKAASALNWAVNEMNQRYDKFAKNGVKELQSYNEYKIANQEPEEVLPEIVIIIDELADLMLAAKAQVEDAIARLAAKARAAGMHLIVATQRPSVDVVTGVIKANIPSRIAFSVSSQIDSRTILDMQGAEKLLGKGDMLFSPVGSNKPLRVQGPFISEEENTKVIEYVKNQASHDYNQEVIKHIETPADSGAGSGEAGDELTDEAIEFILKQKTASVSMLQRRFRIGYNRAARIIDEIEDRGLIGPSDGSKPRQVLYTEEEYYSAMDMANTKEQAAAEPGVPPHTDEGNDYDE